MNSCGTCTACCEVFEIPELEKPARKLCQHCTGKGCGNYEDRPEPCRVFRCAWLAGNWREELRPDKCGVMISQFKEKVLRAWQLEKLVDPLILDQMKYLKETYGVEIEEISISDANS